MTTTKEALKMAIDDARIELGKVRQYLGWQEPKEDELCQAVLKAWKVLDACKEALEQQEQEFFKRGKEIAKWADEQNKQKQEPVYKVDWADYEEALL